MNKTNYKKLVLLLLIPLLATLIYSNTFSGPFLFDDFQNILKNPKIRHLGNFLDLANSRALGFLTFALNYHFGGLNVFGYHLVNLLIHITNGFLVYSLVLLLASLTSVSERCAAGSGLFKASASKTGGSAPFIALATALLFIAHPIQTQAVTYIVQRFASLATLFYLLGVVAYLKWRTGGRLLWYGIALLATVLGMKTKEFLFTLPFMILLVEMVFFTKRRWASLIPFLLTLPIIPLSRFDVLGEEAPLFSGTADISRPDYLFTQFRVIVTYLRLLVFPINQNLDYDYPIYHSLFAPPVFLSFLFLSGLFALAVTLLRRSTGTARHAPTQDQLKLIAFGILWFFLTLSAESSIIPIRDVIFEHRLYLPSVGIFLAFCAAWGLLRPKTFRLLSMGVILLLFSLATYQRNLVWQDGVGFWRDVVQKAPHKARGHYLLGVTYKNEGRLEEAIREYQAAIRIEPNLAEAHNNLGVVYKNQGRLEEAIREYQITLQLKPDLDEAHNNLGVAYKNQGRLEEAIREYQTAIRLQPDNAEAHNNLGVAYKNQGRLEEAIREYQTAIQLQPDYAEAHYNLANAYAKLGRLKEAIEEYQEAIKLQPDFSLARQALDSL